MLTKTIGGCRAQGEPGHGELSTYETFILIDSLSHIVIIGSKVYPGLALVCPGLQPPMPKTVVSQALSNANYCKSGNFRCKNIFVVDGIYIRKLISQKTHVHYNANVVRGYSCEIFQHEIFTVSSFTTLKRKKS